MRCPVIRSLLVAHVVCGALSLSLSPLAIVRVLGMPSNLAVIEGTVLFRQGPVAITSFVCVLHAACHPGPRPLYSNLRIPQGLVVFLEHPGKVPLGREKGGRSG
jgi:hypothetical protein